MMASEVAQPDALHSTLSNDAPITNGDHHVDVAMTEGNADAFKENALTHKTESLDVSFASDPHPPAGPTPTEDSTPAGIAPIADFIPKDAPHASHPTPPPDEPLGTSEANIDAEMTAREVSEVVAEPESQPEVPVEAPAPMSTESSLVRPREDDDEEMDDERAAKRSRFEDQSVPDAGVQDALPVESVAEATMDQPTEPALVPAAEPPVSPRPTDIVAAASTSNGESADVTPRESNEAAAAPSIESAAAGQPEPAAAVQTATETSEPSKASVEAQPASEAPVQASRASYSTEPMTSRQQKVLLEKMKNLKKTKHAVPFLLPVDPIALGIPGYPDVIKNPMDISTMETKLKAMEYATVQDFAHDFDLIINNTKRFNGEAHPITLSGLSMEAYFRRMMETVPSTNEPASAPKPSSKKSSPKPPPSARRESRSATTTTTTTTTVAQPPAGNASTAAAASDAFALQPDGTPQIRRDSSINRPARAIKPPPARELTYSKPKRKEHQLELKFCSHVLQQIKGPRNASINGPFLAPVDPVALNIPQYRQIVKHPMDLGTMTQKLNQGQYGKAAEFKKDFDLMVENCLVFNPNGNPVRDMGIALRREFQAMWDGKQKWESRHKAETQRATSASADEESADEEEEEEEDAGDEDKNKTIAILQKQLAEMQSALAGLNQQPKKKKSKSGVKPSKKGGAVSAAPKQKPAVKQKPAKKPKLVTYEEKQEISEAVNKMDEAQVQELTRIITTNCKKYADQEEMELEIDDLPNDVQALLLKYVRSLFGNPNRGRAISPDDAAAMDDDDFEPERGGRRSTGGAGGSKRKKHKPMGKKEQQDAINNIQRQLSQFKGVGVSASQSPTAAEPDTSGDDESEESEEE